MLDWSQLATPAALLTAIFMVLKILWPGVAWDDVLKNYSPPAQTGSPTTPGQTETPAPPAQPTATATQTPAPPAPSDDTSRTGNFLHTEGSHIVDSNGNTVILTGINWFGMESATYAPHGVWSRNYGEMLDQIAGMGFNTIRLPFSNDLLKSDSFAGKPDGVDFGLNPDLKGLTGLQMIDKIVTGAGQRGLKIILDQHRPNKDQQSNLWYTDHVSEAQWMSDWVMLAKRYAGNDTVIGADLHNEPHGEATWGTGDARTDWQLAAQRAGNAVLSVNPNLLIIVEGVENVGKTGYWWGGNLTGVKSNPVQLNIAGRVVYSPHDYGPGVYMQSWFMDKLFPQNMPGLWDSYWGYVAKDGIAPLLLGEFGGRSVGADLEGTWQHSLMNYAKANGLSYTYWALNPNSGDTGGVLNDDWKTVNDAKLQMLRDYQTGRIGVNHPNIVNFFQAAPGQAVIGQTISAPPHSLT